MDVRANNSLDEIRGSLAVVVNEQNSRLTETSRRQEMVIAGLHDEVFELKNLIKKLQVGEASSRGGGVFCIPWNRG